MGEHERFRYSSAGEVMEAAERLGVELPPPGDAAVLGTPLDTGGFVIPNRLAVQPMEGCDGAAEGRPGEWTFRRYGRFAAGGAGLLWFEATAVVAEARANPRQLLLTDDTADGVRRLLNHALETAAGNDGARPFTVLQLTHSGRYSKPTGEPRPIVAAKNPHLINRFPEAHKIISDEELAELVGVYADAALLASGLGFDAVDIKSCHRYLISELLSAHTRGGEYGGSFEHRTRFLLDIVGRIDALSGGSVRIMPRINVYDAIPFPYGWGVDTRNHHIADLTEPARLVSLLYERGVRLVNVTAGNPYHNPHVNRPYDNGPYKPREHPLEGVARMLGLAREIRKSVPGMAVMASGLSWLRQFGGDFAAGGVAAGWFDMAGFGRQAFAYPGFAADILKTGAMDEGKSCVACGKCSEIMRYGGHTGCILRDKELYLPEYRLVSKGKPPMTATREAEHV